MQLLADENVQQPTVKFLRDAGYDVRSVSEEGLAGSSDEHVFEAAQKLGCALLTFNADFTDIRVLSRQRHRGIVRMRVKNQRAENLHPILRAALERLGDVDLTDTLVTIADDRVRIRKTAS